MDSHFFGHLFSLYPHGDHSPDPSHLVEDDLVDNNPEAAGLGVGNPNDYGAYYSLVDSISLPKTEPTSHFL
jgi:hypothetical protein